MNETQSSSSNPSATSAGLAIGEPIRAFPLARSPRTVLWSSLGIVLLVAGAAGIQGASFPGATLEVGSGGKAEGNTTGGGAMKVERGKWTAERERNSEKIWLQFQRSGQDGVWIPLPAGQPASIAAGREVRFELHRAAGTFSFTGTFDGSGPGAKGSGTYTFQPDPAFAREMESLGHRLPSGDKLLDLAIRDVSPDYNREMQALGYRDLSLSRLSELRAHDVTPQMIRDLADLGYRDVPVERLLEFRMYDVSPALIRELEKLGYNHLPAGQLVDFRLQNVTPTFIREMADLGYRNLSAQQLVELRTQGVDVAYVRELQSQGYRNLTPAQLIERRMYHSASSRR